MSFKAQHIAALLLGGNISSANLETKLTTDDAWLGAWRALLKSGTSKALIANTTAFGIIAGSNTAFGELITAAGTQLAASDSATIAISNDSNAIKTVVTNQTYLDFWNTVPANKARLQARINASGSKLKRQVWTSSGTWTAPVTPIVALSVFAIGGGGTGASGGWNGGSTQAESGGGGSGAESATKSATTSLPTTNQTVTVGLWASTSSFGSFLTAAAGQNGIRPTSGSAQAVGGGSDVGTIYDTDPENAIWQPATANKKGGSGGVAFAGSYNSNGFAGASGLTGGGGAGGTQNGSSCTQANNGTGLGSGGGSGAFIYPYGAGAANGLTAFAPNYGSGGGGGSGTAILSAGGTGAPGLVVAYWVEG